MQRDSVARLAVAAVLLGALCPLCAPPVRGEPQGDSLWDNGAYVTGVGTACEGGDSSAVEPPDLQFGWNTRLGQGRVADDFTVPADETWTLTTMTWRVYQVFASAEEAITEAFVQVYDGNPMTGGKVIAGDHTISQILGSSFSGVYRDQDDLACDRAIKEVLVDMSFVPPLTGGTYWVEISTEGHPDFSGPWANPTVPGDAGTDNGIGFDEIFGTWSELFDSGSGRPQDFPFLLSGTRRLFSLSASGVCPGEVTVTTTGGSGQGAVLGGAGPGADVIPAGSCAGTATGLAGLFPLAPVALDLDVAVTVPASACGLSLQVLQISDCSLTNVATLPE